MAVNPIPEGQPCLSPYLNVRNASALIEFIQAVFDGREVFRLARPDGVVMHAEVRIGDSVVMLGEAPPERPTIPAMLHLYVEDADAVYRRALDAGATSLTEPADQFYGDRNAGVEDSFGNKWWISTHVEDVPFEEMQRRAAAAGR
jgi:PhnB protein